MQNTKIFNGYTAIMSAVTAYESIKCCSSNITALEQATADLLGVICEENQSLSPMANSANTVSGQETLFGKLHIPLCSSQQIFEVLRNTTLPVDDSSVYLPLRIDFGNPFAMLFETEDSINCISELVQNILYCSIEQNHALNIRCVDLASGGTFFSAVIGLISELPHRTGGSVGTRLDELTKMIRDLELASMEALRKFGGNFTSSSVHNLKHPEKIAEYLIVVHLSSSDRCSDTLERLRLLMANREFNNMRFIIAGPQSLVEMFGRDCDYVFHISGDRFRMGINSLIPFEPAQYKPLTANSISELITELQLADMIDTRYEHHPELDTDLFDMDASVGLRIPFALSKSNKVQYFELGGLVPPHALLTGTTGCGKSTTFHSIIMQTLRHYHPDDVEIWAIDFKAVEFNFYIQNLTPHFRVIAHNTTAEFSLGLIDLLYAEFERRQKLFTSVVPSVNGIGEYRQRFGARSIPRILVIIDEFQLLTQALENYSGNINYRNRFDNLLGLGRSMGISFLFASQAVSSGLKGFGQYALEQFGCRLCMMHNDNTEVRETLALSGDEATELIPQAKSLRVGQCIYRRTRQPNEFSHNGKGYEFLPCTSLLFTADTRTEIIRVINTKLKNDYIPKDVIIVRGSNRIPVSMKSRHPLQKFIGGTYAPSEGRIECYPADLSPLSDSYCVDLGQIFGANLLLIGENDELRESVILHSICGFLMNHSNRVVVNILDEQHPKKKHLNELLTKISSTRLQVNVGVDECMKCIHSLKKVRPSYENATIYLWYGLEKLKNELFIHQQEQYEIQASISTTVKDEEGDYNSRAADFLRLIAQLDHSGTTVEADGSLNFDQCSQILKNAFDIGPENGATHFVIFNNRKSMERSGMIVLECFEHRIATAMSTSDSYAIFGTSAAIKSADENTVIYTPNGGTIVPLHPYLLPDDTWLKQFNNALKTHI